MTTGVCSKTVARGHKIRANPPHSTPVCLPLSVPFARSRNESKWRHRTLTMLTHFPLRAGALVAESHDMRGCAFASVTRNPDEFSYARGIFTTALRVRFITDPRTSVLLSDNFFYDIAISHFNLKHDKLNAGSGAKHEAHSEFIITVIAFSFIRESSFNIFLFFRIHAVLI